jgi:hypothetical protein
MAGDQRHLRRGAAILRNARCRKLLREIVDRECTEMWRELARPVTFSMKLRL